MRVSVEEGQHVTGAALPDASRYPVVLCTTG